jgi:hypothetical protein
MKLLFVVVMSALALSAQDTKAATKAGSPARKVAKKTAPTQAVNASQPIAIPASATLENDGDYHYTDPQGKKWLYRKTPFGVRRMEDTPEFSSKPVGNIVGITATEVGDVVRFERPGPFGVWKWEKKKSELDEGEKAALANSRSANRTASQQD